MAAPTYWWKDAKIYELYVDKFAGNFRGLTQKLDYFDRLGVNTLHILPHYPSPMIDGGYDVMDYLNVRPELGTLEDFDLFLKEAHNHNIKIIVDFVLNHVSEHHPWFIEARSSQDAQKRDFFLWSETGRELSGGWNAFPDVKSSNWIYNDATNDYYYATFYPQQPDLNWENPGVAEAMLDNMDFWADRGIDGFRLDATSDLVTREDFRAGLKVTHQILKKIRRHLDEKYGGDIAMMAESHLDVEGIKEFFGEGDECHMAYNFPLTRAMFVSLMRGDRKPLEEMLERSKGIPDNCSWAVFLRNHDEIYLPALSEKERAELLDFLDPARAYPFRNGTETAVRLGTIFEQNPERIHEALELLYAMPGTPIMYYGDEIGMRNTSLQGRIIDSREYVRGHFVWDEAEKQLQDPQSLFNRIAPIVRRAHAPWLARMVLGEEI